LGCGVNRAQTGKRPAFAALTPFNAALAISASKKVRYVALRQQRRNQKKSGILVSFQWLKLDFH
jgi:hypothetical protein